MIGQLKIKPLPCICFYGFLCFLGVFKTKETQRDTISTVTSGSTFDSMYEIALFQLDNPKKYGLPEFVTSCEHDPGNLKFHSRKLNVLRDCKYCVTVSLFVKKYLLFAILRK